MLEWWSIAASVGSGEFVEGGRWEGILGGVVCVCLGGGWRRCGCVVGG